MSPSLQQAHYHPPESSPIQHHIHSSTGIFPNIRLWWQQSRTFLWPATVCHLSDVSSGDHCWRTGKLQSRKEHHRADLQPKNPLWEISPAPARPLPCCHRLQEGLWEGLACSFVGNHEEAQHQCQPYPSHQTPLWWGHQYRAVGDWLWVTVGVW